MRYLLLISIVFGAATLLAQEAPIVPPETRPVPLVPQLPRMNPAMLLKMRDQLTFELQQTQRTLGFIDPNDTQLTATLKEQQKELLSQLKEIGTQLKAQGLPGIENSPLDPESTLPQGAVKETQIPAVLKQDDPTLVSGGTPQPAVPNDVLIQKRPEMRGMPGGMLQPGMMPPQPGMMPGGMMPQPGMPGGMRQPGMMDMVQPGMLQPGMAPGEMSPAGVPTDFDQDQAWANSPWAPKPSKELSELKQTVDSLRKELAEMKESVKALETQIQLLNRNILLTQPKTP